MIFLELIVFEFSLNGTTQSRVSVPCSSYCYKWIGYDPFQRFIRYQGMENDYKLSLGTYRVYEIDALDGYSSVLCLKISRC